jgi:hypothetical protein
MTLLDLSSIGSFVSGLAVLASLVFVGYQIQRNTRAVRASASQAHSANWQQIITPIIEHEGVARLWRKGTVDIRSLTDDERARFFVMTSGLLRFWEGARLQWRHGQLDEGHWRNVEQNAIDFKSQPGIQTVWGIRRHWYSAEFQEWYEALEIKTPIPLYEIKAEG